ncbi:MAG: hypothetical protein WBV82_06840 [Myxococcaceae bacterium]
MRKSILVSVMTLAGLFSGCGNHIGFDLQNVQATRQEDNRVKVSADVTMSLAGPAEWAQDIQEVCAEATWTEASDAGTGGLADENADALFTAKACTTEPWADKETKVLTLTSAEAIPQSPSMVVTVRLSVTAPEDGMNVVISEYDSTVPSP